MVGHLQTASSPNLGRPVRARRVHADCLLGLGRFLARARQQARSHGVAVCLRRAGSGPIGRRPDGEDSTPDSRHRTGHHRLGAIAFPFSGPRRDWRRAAGHERLSGSSHPEDSMYKSIYVPVDNSDHSNRAVACSMALGKAFSAKLVGCHVYAAKLHDYRFRQMEYTLPEEYIDEVELERQRKIHDSLITMGLKLISDSYLDGMSRLCGESGLAFEPRMMDGKHHTEILKDLAGSQNDLVVIGALGVGRARDSVIGSVCERVARQSDRDVWVVKHVPEPGEPDRDTILVGIDGSPQSFGALMTAIKLARTFGKQIEAIAVYDPYLHYSVFNGIVNVLTEQAAKV